jgi:putative flippase GtrA
MSAAQIAAVYTLVSFAAILVNIGTQAFSLLIYSGPYEVELSVLTGTVAGLPVKYVLEKKYVFRFKAKNLGHDARFFIFYSLMGVFTTVIFWGVEFAFHFIFNTDMMRYLGGILGLTVGSYVKYQLDKRYVFKKDLV